MQILYKKYKDYEKKPSISLRICVFFITFVGRFDIG